LPTIAVDAADELQVTTEVKSCVLPSLKVPVAVNCCVAPRTTVGVGGFIAIETSVTGLTTSVADPLTDPELTLIVVVPAPKVLASPAVTAVSLMVATEAAVELQCPLRVRLCDVPSENVPVAVNGCVVPTAIVAVGGLMAIETSVADVTVSSLEPLTNPKVAEMLAVPCATLVANPALLIVAVVGVSDDQVAVLVRFCVLPSV
jgi:hypothetical protein